MEAFIKLRRSPRTFEYKLTTSDGGLRKERQVKGTYVSLAVVTGLAAARLTFVEGGAEVHRIMLYNPSKKDGTFAFFPSIETAGEAAETTVVDIEVTQREVNAIWGKAAGPIRVRQDPKYLIHLIL